MTEASALDRRAVVKSGRLEQLARMVEIRVVEDRIQGFFNDGYVRGSTHLSIGQEAVSVGIAREARPTDIVAGTYRGHGIALALGVTPEGVMGEIVGRQIGCSGGLGGSMHLCDMSVGLFPTSAIVGAQIPHAVGAALTAHVNGTDDAAIAIFGDGATNIGTFHESLNLAAVWNLPVVFVCENNLYGEYSPIRSTTPVDDIASRAVAYGMPGIVVDGQDVDAVGGAVAEALERARAGEGPTLLEMKTYRYSGHSRSDPATYRPEGELEVWQGRDPITIFCERLVAEGLLEENGLEQIQESVTESVEVSAQLALASPEPELSAMFEHISGGVSA
ncbi:MAG: thiamine pyrophosphate-dependent dehydrogenase E1 component subunit alpha [Actinomycetota bacterium]